MSAIEWTDETWNPVLGCSKVSPGCDHCYAIGQSHRNTAMGSPAYQPALTVRSDSGSTDWTGEVRLVRDRLDQPSRWPKPRRVFVNSMSDLFHPDVPVSFIVEVFAVMATTPRHTYQVLTKRPQVLARLLNDSMFRTNVAVAITVRLGVKVELRHMESSAGCRDLGRAIGNARVEAGMDRYETWPLPNVWLGTSIEDDRYSFRADHLRSTPAAVRFVSAEPLLGPLPNLDLTGIDWLIVGGESGAGARPMHPDWVRDLRDECADRQSCPECGDNWKQVYEGEPVCGYCANGGPLHPTAFFFKQWGQFAPVTDRREPRDEPMVRHGSKKAAGRTLDGRVWDEYPEVNR